MCIILNREAIKWVPCLDCCWGEAAEALVTGIEAGGACLGGTTIECNYLERIGRVIGMIGGI